MDVPSPGGVRSNIVCLILLTKFTRVEVISLENRIVASLIVYYFARSSSSFVQHDGDQEGLYENESRVRQAMHFRFKRADLGRGYRTESGLHDRLRLEILL